MRNPKILFVGIAPGPDEDAANRCFHGRAGRLLDDVIRELGIPQEELAYDNVVHCIPWLGNLQGTSPRDPDEEDIVNCVPYLYRLIQMIDPEVIVTLGTLPFRVVMNEKYAFITDRHGIKEEVMLCGKMRKVIGTFHPAAALRQNSSKYRDALKEDIWYAWEYAIGKYFLPKWRVINDTDEAVEYIKKSVDRFRAGDYTFIAYDTETPQILASTKEKRETGLEFVNQDLWRDDKKVVGFGLSYIPKDVQSFRDVEGVWIVMDHVESKTDYFAIMSTLRWALDKEGEIKIPVACHNAKYDKSWTFEKFKFRMLNFHDTMMGSYAYYGNSRRHGLGLLTHRLLKYDLFKDETEEQLAAMPPDQRSFRNLPLDSIGRRGAVDAAGTASLAVFENMLLSESGQDKVLMPLLNTAVETFTEMELRGCAVDYEFWQKLVEKYPRMMDDEFQILVNLPMVKAYCEDRRLRWTRDKKGKLRAPNSKFVFNPSSPDHRYELLYVYYNLPTELAVETGSSTEENKVFSTNENSRHQMTAHCRIEDNNRVKPGPMRKDAQGNWCKCRCYVDGWDTFVQDQDGREFRTWSYHTPENYQHYGVNPHVECLQFMISLRFWGKLAKLQRSYVTKIEHYFRPEEWQARNGIASDVRIISFNYLMHWTKTGRMSTRDWSVHTAPWHSDIRRMHCSRWKSKGGILISADYSQLELRIAAAIANDRKLIEAYNQGKDIHRVTAAAVYQVPESHVTKDMRRYSKTISFRLIYGGGAHAIHTETGLPMEESQKLVKGFLEHYDGLDRHIKSMHSHVKKLGWVPTPIGRKFYMPDIYSDERERVAGALRDSQNWPIQSTASDVTMAAINEVTRITKEYDFLSHVWAMIHDAIESDVHPGELYAYYQIMKHCMERRVRDLFDWLVVPMVADFEIGVRWDGSLNIGFGDFKDPAAIIKRYRDANVPFEMPDWYDRMKTVIKDRDEDGMFTPRRLVLYGRKEFFQEMVQVMSRGYDIGSKIHFEMPVEIGEELVLRKSYEGESGGEIDCLGEIFFKTPLRKLDLV